MALAFLSLQAKPNFLASVPTCPVKVQALPQQKVAQVGVLCGKVSSLPLHLGDLVSNLRSNSMDWVRRFATQGYQDAGILLRSVQQQMLERLQLSLDPC